MKRGLVWIMIVFAVVMFGGCGQEQDAQGESVQDATELRKGPAKYDMAMGLPSDGQAIFEDETCQVFSQEDVTVTTQIMQADSLEVLLKELTGMDQQRLTVMKTWQDEMPRYDLTWVSAGEGGLNVYRSAILDDGQSYYVATASVPEECAGKNTQRMEDWISTLVLTPNK